MDELHPITRFLQKHGYLVRGSTIGLILCLMLNTGFLSFGDAQAEANFKVLYFGLFLLGTFSPSVGHLVFAPFWQKITPIKDRTTYAENEIVFIGSTLIGVTAALFFWVMIPVPQAFRISFWAVLAGLPVFFLVWLTNATLSPLEFRDTSHDIAEAQAFRDETPHFWNNGLAYLIAAASTAVVLTSALFLVLKLKGVTFDVGDGCLSFVGLIFTNLIAAPLFIWIGRKLRPRDNSPNGFNLSLGAIVFLTIIVALNAPAIFKNGFDLNGIADAWPVGVAYGMMVLSYISGGIAFSRFYKPKPVALEFA